MSAHLWRRRRRGRSQSTLFPVALAALVFGGGVSAQSLDWFRLPPGDAPSARSGHAIACDGDVGDVVLFGGRSEQLLGDTWRWDGASWSLAPSAAAPSARAGHALAWHAPTGRFVLFGGASANGVLGDTWTFDGATWQQAAGGPPARRGHAMVYDAARQELVLFGGHDGAAPLADTWRFDGLAWTAAQPPAGPVARSDHAMSYDEGRSVVVMFGGRDAGQNALADTWEWNGAVWVPRLSAVFPPARSGHALAYDRDAGHTVLVAGRAAQVRSDAWRWNGSTWAPLTPAGAVPAPRVEHALVYASRERELLLFGGDNDGALPDTWLVANNGTVYGAGCGAPPLGFVPDPALPQVGGAAVATITNAATPLAGVSLGLSRDLASGFPLPLALDGLGMTGCELLQSADVIGLPASPLTPTTLGFTLALPNDPALVGVHLYAQAYAFAPGQNPLGVVVSNGIDWRVTCPPLAPQVIVEDFTSDQQLDQPASAGAWANGSGTFRRIGGDGRHGAFDLSMATDTGVVIAGRSVYELDCDHTVIPAGQSFVAGQQVVTDGRFFFTTFELPANVHLRIVGSSPPVITVRGLLSIAGVIDVSGEDVGPYPVTMQLGQSGGRGGVFGGAGGAGGARCLGFGPGAGAFDGSDGEDVRVLSGNAYAAATVGTGGRGSALYPASGLNADQQFGTSPPSGLMYCLSATAGGGGGGMLQPGGVGRVTAILDGAVPIPNQASFMGPASGASAAMTWLPAPAGPLPNALQFLYGGSGGGGAASNCSLSLSLARTWAPGAGGGGGGGAIALRAGHALDVASSGAVLARGGSAADSNGIGAGAQVAPGGGGAGGSIVLQVGGTPTLVEGELNVAGGRGGRFSRRGGAGLLPQGGTVEIAGGDGSPGFLRYESPLLLPTYALPNAVPPVTTQNIAQLTDLDDLVGVRSKFYATGLACGPAFVRYELLAQVDGVNVTFSDDPSVAPLPAGIGAPVRLWFQAAHVDPVSGVATPAGPWRAAVRSSPGTIGIDVDGGSGYRFSAVFDRALATTVTLDRLEVVYRN
ncbi:MAG: hypothetical protein KAI24_14440 [Planctomycetes bacterium]|nr:hypothetical protein [Planctomycetota bacterium]